MKPKPIWPLSRPPKCFILPPPSFRSPPSSPVNSTSRRRRAKGGERKETSICFIFRYLGRWRELLRSLSPDLGGKLNKEGSKQQSEIGPKVKEEKEEAKEKKENLLRVGDTSFNFGKLRGTSRPGQSQSFLHTGLRGMFGIVVTGLPLETNRL